jgi:hypothetical protein
VQIICTFVKWHPVPLKRVVHVVSGDHVSRNSLLERWSTLGEVLDFLKRMCDEVAKERNLWTAGRTLAGSVILLLLFVSWRSFLVTVSCKIKFMGSVRAMYFGSHFFNIDCVANCNWYITEL